MLREAGFLAQDWYGQALKESDQRLAWPRMPRIAPCQGLSAGLLDLSPDPRATRAHRIVRPSGTLPMSAALTDLNLLGPYTR